MSEGSCWSGKDRTMSEWMPIETAPKGGGAERVDDPAWVDPPRIMLHFADEGPEATVIAYWDWYYASGGQGHYDRCSGWVVSHTGETTDLHFGTQPTHWTPLPAPPAPTSETVRQER